MSEPKVMQMLHRQMEKNYEEMKNLSAKERIKKISAESEIVKKKISLKKSEAQI